MYLEKDKTRAQTRANAHNQKERYKKYWWKEYHEQYNYDINHPEYDAKMAAESKTPQRCSCWMCGNPRKFSSGKDALTIHEQSENFMFIFALNNLEE